MKKLLAFLLSAALCCCAALTTPSAPGSDPFPTVGSTSSVLEETAPGSDTSPLPRDVQLPKGDLG